MPRTLPVICLFVFVLVAGAAAAPRVLELPGPDKAALAAEDAARLALQGGPERFAWPHDLVLRPEDGEAWERLPGGGHRWRLVVRAPGSLSLNFGFTRFRLPWGGRLTITGERGPERVFTADDNAQHGELWTPVVLGDEARLSLELPAGARDDFALELTRIGRGYRLFGEPPAEKVGDCNIDVVCSEGDAWRHEIRSVGVYTLNGFWDCSGAMINNTAEDGRPLFLTANHCGVTAANDQTLVVYWNYESPECGMLSGGSLEDTQSGTLWLASWAPSDMTLVEFLARPDPGWQVSFAGWDRSDTANVPSAVTIHHPSTDEKCISFENDPLEVTSYLSFGVPGDGTHWRVVDWDLGTTEPGSSGCPLFNPQRRIIGQLHGGQAACGNDLSDWYGRLSVSWLGGETSETQLAYWLDPLGTGQATLGGGEPEVPTSFAFRGAIPNPAVGPTASLAFELPRAGQVRLRIYDLRGRLVATLRDEVLGAGFYAEPWVATGAASGVYFARLEALGETSTRAFTLLR